MDIIICMVVVYIGSIILWWAHEYFDYMRMDGLQHRMNHIDAYEKMGIDVYTGKKIKNKDTARSNK